VFDPHLVHAYRWIAAMDSGFSRDVLRRRANSSEVLVWTEQYCSEKHLDMDQYTASQGDRLS
jgi:hypothetical protein